jgi:hypothetical protein
MNRDKISSDTRNEWLSCVRAPKGVNGKRPAESTLRKCASLMVQLGRGPKKLSSESNYCLWSAIQNAVSAQFRVRSSDLSRKLLDTTCGFVPYGNNRSRKVLVKECHSFMGEGFVFVLTAYSAGRTPGRCLEFEPDHLFLRIFEADALDSHARDAPHDHERGISLPLSEFTLRLRD